MIAIFAIIILFSLAVFAKSGDVIGNIYSTDILAFINDCPVQSYNIGGKTAIILEDLAEYGFYSSYSDELRTLVTATGAVYESLPHKQISRGKFGGRILGDIYETDIKIYVNGLSIKTYAINGKTAVTIEDLGEITDGSPYSQYGMKCVWDGKDRTIKLYFIYDNTWDIFDLIGDKPLRFECVNDEVNITVDHFSQRVSYYGPGDFTPPNYYPLYCGGQRVGTGFHQKKAYLLYYSPDEVELIEEECLNSGRNYDLDALKKIIDKIVITPPTYDEALEYYTGFARDGIGRIDNRIDTDGYTFLYITYFTPHGGSQILVRIDRNGECKDYSEDFESVSFWGQKYFDNVTIDAENETVTFGYDVYYIIDLKTGKMTKK